MDSLALHRPQHHCTMSKVFSNSPNVKNIWLLMANPFLLQFSKGLGPLVQRFVGDWICKGCVLAWLFHSLLLAFCSPATEEKKMYELNESEPDCFNSSLCHCPGRLLNHCNNGLLSHAHLSISLSYFLLSDFFLFR